MYCFAINRNQWLLKSHCSKLISTSMVNLLQQTNCRSYCGGRAWWYWETWNYPHSQQFALGLKCTVCSNVWGPLLIRNEIHPNPGLPRYYPSHLKHLRGRVVNWFGLNWPWIDDMTSGSSFKDEGLGTICWLALKCTSEMELGMSMEITIYHSLSKSEFSVVQTHWTSYECQHPNVNDCIDSRNYHLYL